MTRAAIADLATTDLDWVLETNRVHEALLSPLDRDGLARLVAMARLARVVPGGGAFLVALDQDADYDSPNFLWFRARWPRFLYIDRVAVAPGRGGEGFGRRLYDDLFRFAEEHDFGTVCAEVNSNPPNTGSIAFHERLGFQAVGEESPAGLGKTVRYFACTLGVGPPAPRSFGQTASKGSMT